MAVFTKVYGWIYPKPSESSTRVSLFIIRSNLILSSPLSLQIPRDIFFTPVWAKFLLNGFSAHETYPSYFTLRANVTK
jgi:hypothetical protein